VMHATGLPGGMPHVAPMDDAVGEVTRALAASAARAEAAGVSGVVVDAGFGFGKTPADNLALVAASGRIRDALNRPVLLGISRKATIGALLGTPEAPAPVEDRLYGTLGVTAAGVLAGAALVRTHDVRATVELLRGLAAVARSGVRGQRSENEG
jgi:dihydropteroate synthase